MNISKKKVMAAHMPGVIKSASDVTDTGFGSVGLDWDFEDNDAEDISEDSGKEEVF